jgi:hypothetical protein
MKNSNFQYSHFAKQENFQEYINNLVYLFLWARNDHSFAEIELHEM